MRNGTHLSTLAANGWDFCVRVHHLAMRAYVGPLCGWNEAQQASTRLYRAPHGDNAMKVDPTECMKVKITRIACIPLRIPFTVPFKIASGGARPFIETLIVKVHTDAGV